MRILRFALLGALLSGVALGQPSVAGGSTGVAATNHPMATFVAMEVLLEGGNAVDAAVAAAATLGVAEPYLSGLGGDGFMLVYWAQDDEVYALDFSGRAPAGLDTLEGGMIPFEGPNSVAVPGAAAGWHAALERFGTLPVEQILEPAASLAQEGFPASAYAADAMSWAAAQFLDWEEMGALAWWDGEFFPPGVGDTIRNERLAQTYRSLAENGLLSFYDGEIAAEIVDTVQRLGGVLTAEDLMGIEARWVEPISVGYRGYEVFAPPLNSTGGLATLQALRILEGFELGSLEPESAEWLHLLIESAKLAAADRAVWGGDPEFLAEEIPYGRLLSSGHADELRAKIDPQRSQHPGEIGENQQGTSHISIADRHGNLVSMTLSIGAGWGSGFVAGETGVVLNNSLSLFDASGESAARLEPGKRVPWNMSPLIIYDGDTPWMAIGTPGGTGIWQTLPQVISRIVDHDQPVDEAVIAPRFRWNLSSVRVNIEERFPEPTLATLEEMGHEVSRVLEFAELMGAVTAVYVDDDGRLQGVADPRREGYVIGW